MEQVNRIELVRQLAKLAELVEADSIVGFTLIAVHPSGNITTIAATPHDGPSVEKLLVALDRTTFRLKAVCYLKPEDKGKLQ